VGGERRQSLIDVEIARKEFRLDVLKLREELGAIVPPLRPKEPAAETKVARPTVPAAPPAAQSSA
jgi:hypothetical protein